MPPHTLIGPRRRRLPECATPRDRSQVRYLPFEKEKHTGAQIVHDFEREETSRAEQAASTPRGGPPPPARSILDMSLRDILDMANQQYEWVGRALYDQPWLLFILIVMLILNLFLPCPRPATPRPSERRAAARLARRSG